MQTMLRNAFAAMVALVAGAGALLAPGQAQSLSFSIPAGRTVVDIDLSTSVTGFSYDGGTETLSLTADVDAFRLDDSSTVSLDPGDVTMNVTLMLQAPISVVPAGFDTIATGYYANGLAFDLTLIDSNGTPSTGDDELVFGADYTGNVQLQITDSTFFGITGDFGGGTQAGAFTVGSVNPALAGQIPLSGDLSALLVSLSPSSLAALDDGSGGFNSFTAQPNVDFNFSVPEPGMALLLGSALLAMGARRLRRR